MARKSTRMSCLYTARCSLRRGRDERTASSVKSITIIIMLQWSGRWRESARSPETGQSVAGQVDRQTDRHMEREKGKNSSCVGMNVRMDSTYYTYVFNS